MSDTYQSDWRDAVWGSHPLHPPLGSAMVFDTGVEHLQWRNHTTCFPKDGEQYFTMLTAGSNDKYRELFDMPDVSASNNLISIGDPPGHPWVSSAPPVWSRPPSWRGIPIPQPDYTYPAAKQPERKVYVKERYKLPAAVVDEIQSMSPDFGYGQFSEVVFYRTYSRVKDDGSMETWNDVVVRVVEGVFSIRKDHYLKNSIHWDEDFWNTYARGFALSMFHMHWLPPGRGLWSMGTDFIYDRGSMALNNCGFITVDDDIGACADWIMDALMCGVGIGFEPVRNDDFEVYYPTDEYVFDIQDTRESWCESVKRLIDSYCSAGSQKPVFDYSLIRAAGLPIKGFGGISSGPEPLIKLHKRIDMFFEMYMDKDWYDTILLKADIINCIGACVVAGNVRRSAEICLGNIHDQVFLDLKDYVKYPYRAEWGWMSNNSAMLDVSDDFEQLNQIAKRVITRGEPGILNRKNAKYGRLGKHEDNAKLDAATGCNPCLLGTDLVLKKTGLCRFFDLKIGDEIWSQTGWTTVLNKWSNGIKDVYRWHTTTGYIDLTPNHKIVSNGEKEEIDYAESIDTLVGPSNVVVSYNFQDVMDGLVQGDGCYDAKNNTATLCIGENDYDYFNSEIKDLIIDYHDDTQYNIKTTIDNLGYTYNRIIPERFITGPPSKVAGFLRGLFSANGSFVGGYRITLNASSKSVITTVCKMLSSLGIASTYITRPEHTVEFKNGNYICKESYILNIARKLDIQRFMRLIGFLQQYKNTDIKKYLNNSKINRDNLKNNYGIKEVEYLGQQEVFDITVDNYCHTFWCDGFNVSNCGEQLLESKELCTLVETLPTRCPDVQTWYKSCEYATVYASTVTLLPTHRPDTNSVMLRNRRIGVGIVDFSGWKHNLGLNQVIKHLRRGYEIVRSINHWVQSEAGVPDSIRVTTAKPGGSVPKIAGRTAGIGHPNFHEMVRRMRIAMDSPIVQLLIDANVPYEVDAVSDNTYVFEFPVKQGPAKPASEVSVWEQVSNVATVQREWSDNAVSNTITFIPEYELALSRPINTLTGEDFKQFEGKDFRIDTAYDTMNIYVRNEHHEEGDLEHVLASHAFSIKSLSLLPASNRGCYRQMPEEGISVKEYNERVSKIKKIDWSRLRHSVSEPEKYCTGESCEIPQ